MGNCFSILMIALGGATGAVSRYSVSKWMLRYTLDWTFPIATFTINVMGCLLIGVLAGVGERFNWLTSDLRLLLITGVLGGFTTFSAFGLETFTLLRRGELWVAMGYVGLSVVLGLLLLWLGFVAVTTLGSPD